MEGHGMGLEELSKCNLCESKLVVPIDRRNNICRCRDCGYVFDNPRPTIDEIAEFYSRPGQYNSWLENEIGRDILWQRRLSMVRNLKSGGKLLDVGCGIGQFLFWAKDYFEVKGTEISESAIRIAKDKYGLDLVKGEIERVDLGDVRFDVITIFHTLEHVPHPDSFMKRCKELLSDEGIIIIAVPNDVKSLKNVARIILSILKIGRFKNLGKFGLPKIAMDSSLTEIHLSHFTRSTLKKWLTSLDLAVIQDTLDPYYASVGIGKLFNDIYYSICRVFRNVFGVNLYDTTWIVVKNK
jgi:2-polyprenyl-3-methyl-5-hydroxy-6-metoxy-1,4-benzoquinol methylase